MELGFGLGFGLGLGLGLGLGPSHSPLLARPSRAPTVPEGHGVGAELPLAHQLVRVQRLHSVWLVLPVYLPAGHSSHRPSPPRASKEPGGHLVCFLLPVGA